jgi:peptidoglycan/LPS O-acetylase OafA/YrhL
MRAFEQRRGRLILAVALIGGGALLLVLRLLDWRIADHFWPFFVIVPGAALFAVAALARGREMRFLAAAGAVVAGSGLILLLQSLTDYFQSWAYAWTLLPVFAGAALLLIGRRDADPEAVASARRLLQLGGVMFVVFAAVFEGLIFHDGLIAGGFIVPILLIALGLFVLLRGMFPLHGGDANDVGSGSGSESKGPPAVAQS